MYYMTQFLIRKILMIDIEKNLTNKTIDIIVASAILAVVSGRENVGKSPNISVLSILSLVRNLCHTVCNTKEHKVVHGYYISPIIQCHSNVLFEYKLICDWICEKGLTRAIINI